MSPRRRCGSWSGCGSSRCAASGGRSRRGCESPRHWSSWAGGGWCVLRRLTPGPDSRVSQHAHLVADDLGDLSTDELRDVLSSFDQIVSSDSVAVPDSTTDLRQLDPQQLRAVLRSLEG